MGLLGAQGVEATQELRFKKECGVSRRGKGVPESRNSMLRAQRNEEAQATKGHDWGQLHHGTSACWCGQGDERYSGPPTSPQTATRECPHHQVSSPSLQPPSYHIPISSYLILQGQHHPNTKTRQRHYKKGKLQVNLSCEHRCKNHKQNISKANPTMCF